MSGACEYRTHGGIMNAFKGLIGEPEGKDYLEDLDADGRLILKWILRTWDERNFTGLFWLKV
jgi:hypothetical protein